MSDKPLQSSTPSEPTEEQVKAAKEWMLNHKREWERLPGLVDEVIALLGAYRAEGERELRQTWDKLHNLLDVPETAHCSTTLHAASRVVKRMNEYKQRAESAESHVRELEGKLTKARLGLEWRDDVLADWCASVNVKEIAEDPGKRQKTQDVAFDKTNNYWENDPSGLELSPYQEKFLIQTDSYQYMDDRLHEWLDKHEVPRNGMGSYLRLGALATERDNLKQQLSTARAGVIGECLELLKADMKGELWIYPWDQRRRFLRKLESMKKGK